MPNDLTAQRNLSNQRLAASGFTASVWTLSGVVLVACGGGGIAQPIGAIGQISKSLGNISRPAGDAVNIFNLGEGGNNSGGRDNVLHVQKSPVLGSRIYFFAFDEDGDGTITRTEKNGQDEQLPTGYVTDENGRARNVSGNLYGTPFAADLAGAINADTDEELSGEYLSIANAQGLHLLASPITDFIARQLRAGVTTEDVIAGMLPAGANSPEDVARFLMQILDPSNYLKGGSGVEALADYFENLKKTQTTPTNSEVQAEIAKLLPADADEQDDTLIILSDDDDTSTGIVDIETTITPNDKYVATVAVVSHEGDVSYRLVEMDANGNYVPYTGGAYTINERGVISVVDGATPTDTTLFVEITNGDETEYVRVEITVATTFPTLDALPDGAEVATIAENEIGTQGGTDLITGITPTAPLTNPIWMIRETVPTGFAYKFAIVADGGAYNLVLKEGESLDFEAIPGGIMNLRFWVVENNLRSNALEVAITITDADDAPVFQNEVQNPDLNYSAEIAEDVGVGMLVARVNAIDVDATDSSNALRYTIASGNTGEAFSINEATGAIYVARALDFETTPSYTLEIIATDNGEPAMTGTAMVEITIIDVNDVVPIVTPPQDNDFTIRTTASAGIDVDNPTGTDYRIMIDDADTNNEFTFSVSDERFDFIDQGNGIWELSLKAGEAIPEPAGHEIRITYQVNDGIRDAADSGSLTLMVIDTPVEFTSIPTEQELIADENDANWQVQVVAESVNNDGVVSPIASYDFVGDHDGFAIDSNGIITPDASTGGLDYEAGSTRTLTIIATDSNTPLPSTDDMTIIVTIRNLDEGNAGYEIAELSVGGTDTLEAIGITPDPDEIVEGTLRFRWFTTPDRALTKNYLSTEATVSSTLDITDLPPLVDEIYGVTISYMDNHDLANDEMTMFDVIVSPIIFSEASYIGSGNEDSTGVALPRIVANVANAPPASTLTYSFTPNGISNHLFAIDANSGVITLVGGLDYETATSHALGVRATYDNDGNAATTDDIFTRDVAVAIAVNDLNDNAPAFGQLQVALNPLVRAGLPKTRDTDAAREFISTPEVNVSDFVDADQGVDIINGRGGHDHIFAGVGNDHIFLGGNAGSFETIYQRFGSTDSDDWTSIDGVGGGDSINNFRLGEDALVFIDTDATIISLTDFLNSNQLRVAPIIDDRNLVGVEIYFLDEVVVSIDYNDPDGFITILDEDGNYLPAAERFLGTLSGGIPQGYAAGFLTDNHLLLNYFNADADDNYLQIRDEAYLTLVATDVFISESRTSADAEFANLLAVDRDLTEAYRQVRYAIIAGNEAGHFTLDTTTGALSVAEGVTLDYDSISSYTLTVTATDGLDADGNPDTSPDDTIPIIITLFENIGAVYEVARDGNIFRAEIATADPEGVRTSTNPMYQWYTTDGTSNTLIGSAVATNSFDASQHNPASGAIAYGVTITYTDGSGKAESVDATASISFLDDVRAFTFFEGAEAATQGIELKLADALGNEADLAIASFNFVDESGATQTQSGIFSIDANTNTLEVSTSEIDYRSLTPEQQENGIAVKIRGATNLGSVDADFTIFINGEAIYEVTDDGGTILTATASAADPDGVDASTLMYQWFTTTDGGATKTDIGTPTTSNTFDTATHTLAAGALYGVVVTYTDDAGNDESVEDLQRSIRFTDDTGNVVASSVTGTDADDLVHVAHGLGHADTIALTVTTAIVGSGTASYVVSGGADRDLFALIGALNSGGEFTTTLHLDLTHASFVLKRQYEVEITATDSDTGDTDILMFTYIATGVNTGGASAPAPIPTRQATQAEVMIPDDADLTPIPPTPDPELI